MLDSDKMEVRAFRQGWDRDISLTIGVRSPSGGLAIATNLTFNLVPEGCFLDPTVRLGKDAAQDLMDELWQVGIRPTEGSGSAGSLAATEKHLEDMKKIAFGLLQQRKLI